MELIVYKPTEDQFIKSIDFNFDQIKQELRLALEKYDGIVYTDDNIPLAKSDRAALNKFKDAIETKRKEIKKQCLKPYEDFEAKIKEITALIDKPILAIDGQVKAYEQTKKDEKKADILKFYKDHVGELADLLPFERIFNEKWMNATYSMKAATDEITEAIQKVSDGIEVITGLHSEFELQIKDVFLRTLDLSSALQEKARLEAQKARLEEYERQKAEAQPAPKEPAQTPFKDAERASAEQVHIIDFRVWATSAQLADLKAFMIRNNIKYGKVF